MKKINKKREKIIKFKLIRKAKRKHINKCILKKDFRKKWIYKKYFDTCISKDKNYIYKLFLNKSYSLDLFKYLILNSNLNSLDFLSFFKSQLLNENEYVEGDFLSPLRDERLKTPSWSFFIKRYLWYILEWHILFSEWIQPSNVSKKFSNKDINIFKSWLDNFLENWIYETIFWKDVYLPSTQVKLNISIVKDKFYNDIFISWYHQEATQYSLFTRILFIFNELEDCLSNIDTAKKYLMILVSIIYYANSRKVFIIDIDILINDFLPNTIISKWDILDFFGYIWMSSYSEYLNNIRDKWVKHYFPETKSYNFINIELEIHKTPFIDISNQVWKEWLYIFDETYLLRKFYTKLEDFTATVVIKKNPKKLSFWDLVEIYIDRFTTEWLKFVWNSEKYKIMQWVEFKKPDGEIDLMIYNNETKNLLIFEAKDYIALNENLFRSWDVENLTKITKRFTNWKYKDVPWEIYYGINQLFKHNKRDKSKIAWKLWVDSINEIKYIFLNHHNSMFWNEIVRHFIDKNKEFKWLDYQFMNLYEFEKLISLWCKNWIDFFDLMNEKSIPIKNNEWYKSILERFQACNKWREFSTENICWLNQDLDIFLWMKYWYWWEELAPFINNEIFSDFFKN